MNSHERRIAILLNRAIVEAVGQEIRVFHLEEGRDLTQALHVIMKFERVDEDRLLVVFSERCDRAGAAVNVPLVYVSAVWQDAADGGWSMSVRGTLYPKAEGVFRFRPLGGA